MLRRLALRLATVVVVLVVTFLLLLLLNKQLRPAPLDTAQLAFNWQVPVPESYLKPFNGSFQFNVRLDAHAHTTLSDGVLTPAQVVDWGIAHRYDAMIISDHNTVNGALAAREYAEKVHPGKMVILSGQEYSCCRIHMNIIGVDETIRPEKPFPTDEELKAVIDRVHSLGGLVVANHVAWSNRTTDGYQEATLPQHPTREQLLAMGVDGIEVVNGNTLDTRSLQFQAEHANAMFAVTGSDLHAPDGAYAWTLLNVANRTQAGILAELRARRTSFIIDAGGTRPRAYADVSSAWMRFGPLAAVNAVFEYFYEDVRGMYSFQGSFCQPGRVVVYWSMLGWLILWLILGVIFFECLFTMGRLLLRVLKRRYAHSVSTLWQRLRHFLHKTPPTPSLSV